MVFALGASAVGISFNWFKGRFVQDQSLEKLWAAKSVSPEEFTQLYVSLLKEMVADCQVEITAPLELEYLSPVQDGSFKICLDHPYKDTQTNPQNRKTLCAHYIAQFIASSSVKREIHDIDPNKIIPVIKDRRYINNLPIDANSKKPLIYENLVADIYVTYAVDEEHSLRFLLPTEFEDLNMSFEQLRTLAVDNLQKILPQGKVLQHDHGFLIEADGQNEAALLLLDSMWEQLTQTLGGQIVAAVPSRSMLICTTRETDGGIAKLKELAHMISANESYLISETLLIRQNGKWEVFEEKEEYPNSN
jgi:uncharacterized protein YtpQ (UPF0354 family)